MYCDAQKFTPLFWNNIKIPLEWQQFKFLSLILEFFHILGWSSYLGLESCPQQLHQLFSEWYLNMFYKMIYKPNSVFLDLLLIGFLFGVSMSCNPSTIGSWPNPPVFSSSVCFKSWHRSFNDYSCWNIWSDVYKLQKNNQTILAKYRILM